MQGKELTEIGLLKAAGAVAFTDGRKSVANAQVMRRALTYARDFDALIVHHTEDADLVGDGVMNEGEFAARLGLVGIPKAAETIMLERDLRLVATDRRPLPRGIDELRGIRLTCSGAPKMRALRSARPPRSIISRSTRSTSAPTAPFCKMMPPLRAEEDRSALVEALGSGLLDVVMSDHDPQDVETKRLPFAEAAPGAIGLETMLTAALRLVHSGEIELLTLLLRRCRRGPPSFLASRAAR